MKLMMISHQMFGYLFNFQTNPDGYLCRQQSCERLGTHCGHDLHAKLECPWTLRLKICCSIRMGHQKTHLNLNIYISVREIFSDNPKKSGQWINTLYPDLSRWIQQFWRPNRPESMQWKNTQGLVNGHHEFSQCCCVFKHHLEVVDVDINHIYI